MTDKNEAAVKKTPTEKYKTADEMPFEDAVARLETIVKAMEGDGISLDESLALYEEGVALVRRCNRELDAAEQKVRILQRTPEGEIKPTDFATTED